MSNVNKSLEIKVPVLPESVSDAVVISWYKQAGEYVERDEPIVDIETDKVVLEVPSPVSGVLKEIIESDGSTVLAQQTLGIMYETEKNTVNSAETHLLPEQTPTKPDQSDENLIISPAAKKMIIENNLNTNEIVGTGKEGRILKEDVLNRLKTKPEKSLTHENKSQLHEEKDINTLSSEPFKSRQEKRVTMNRLRATIAQRLLDAQQNAAILTTFNEVNMQPVMDLRKRYKDTFEKKHDVKLGFMSFFVKATVEALKQFPAVNASIDGNDIVYHEYFDIGVAVSSSGGLVVPVLRNAESLSMASIEQTIKELAVKARNKQLGLDEITGGTFSITNGGVFGSLLSTPILNPPQSGILGMHKIQDRPMVENGEIVIRPIMYLALSYDHRIIDGREAVQCLVTIKDFIEDPCRLLLEV
ncbi:MAG: 2-oxoglutarate dehydrogenase complex dihydrolipoyllysine-residue succinyltransferase [gamma proteobacterium symbiont of Bathyaustriella thionipta]|nr:2-oxoglutarate dehydrogenase complex dihydrolipoyllysine-residue succinyltransferase [gamma proteobacterium symbiont of Bathyaustriella thionipta]MCU7950679.1 2-oxoglutarate dehydrogenase complex dihydrolipoyllysine-residue succinyltransferase [gamma proteobacterium symbiont of Bathyaustriella thionipta]MCU7952900.1 2-oxoglutarate dehydrogenase complex dihydrolipoyllysine-residue succinyltransferase [gamma proteobacterium symbiont of Bathyaustriella thionipta]MCU7957175.1 2-oxoglutarate dehyd